MLISVEFIYIYIVALYIYKYIFRIHVCMVYARLLYQRGLVKFN